MSDTFRIPMRVQTESDEEKVTYKVSWRMGYDYIRPRGYTPLTFSTTSTTLANTSVDPKLDAGVIASIARQIEHLTEQSILAAAGVGSFTRAVQDASIAKIARLAEIQEEEKRKAETKRHYARDPRYGMF